MRWELQAVHWWASGRGYQVATASQLVKVATFPLLHFPGAIVLVKDLAGRTAAMVGFTSAVNCTNAVHSTSARFP